MKNTFWICLLLPCFVSNSQVTKLKVAKSNISYLPYEDVDTYRNERCKLDMRYFPEEEKVPVLVFFHGGGLNSGSKSFLNVYKDVKMIEVSANYRLSPEAHCPAYIEDASDVVAWVWNNIESYGGDKSRIIVSGYSAGAYLTAMLALDTTYLCKRGVHPDSMWIYFLESAQLTTHFTVLQERGISANSATKIVDEYAPLYHKRYMKPYMVLVTGDRNLDMAGRYEQNTEMFNYMKCVGSNVLYWEFPGEDHSSVCKVARQKLVNSLQDNTFFDFFAIETQIHPLPNEEQSFTLDGTGTLYSLDGKKLNIIPFMDNLQYGITYIYKKHPQCKAIKMIKY